MIKKINIVISYIVIIVLVFSFFSLSFSMSVIDGTKRELKSTLNSFPFKPFFTVSLSIGSYSKNITVLSKCISNPITYLLIDSKEINPQQLTNECLSKEKTTSQKQPDLEKCNVITSADAKELEKSPYIKMAFVKSQLIDNKFRLKYKNILNPVFHCPPGFLEDLGIRLKYGNYFVHYPGSNNIIILTNNLSKEIFGDINPVGKTVQIIEIGYSNTDQHIVESSNPKKMNYLVVGVLTPMSESQKIAFNTFSGAFAPLPKDYEVGVSQTSRYSKLMAIMTNILYVIPEKGKSAKVLQLLKKFMSTKGDGKAVKPVIDSTYENLSDILSVKSREERIKYILYVVLFMLFISIFTSVSFITLDIVHKKRTIYIRRAVGEDIHMLMREYLSHYVLLSFIALGSSLFILFILFPILKNLNVSGNIFNPNVPFSNGLSPHSLYIGIWTTSFGIISAFFIPIVAVWLSLRKMMKKSPISGIKDNESQYINKFNLEKFVLIVIIASSITGIFLSSSIQAYTVKNIELIKNEIQPDIVRVCPTTSNSASILERSEGSVQYTYSDYLMVKKFFKNDGKIGFREVLPEKMQIIFSNISNKPITTRISDATSEFPSLYDFTISRGRFISDNEYREPVCVVGAGIAKKAKVSVKDILLLGMKKYRVIGILKPKNPLVNNTVFVPCGSVVYPKTPYSVHPELTEKEFFL